MGVSLTLDVTLECGVYYVLCKMCHLKKGSLYMNVLRAHTLYMTYTCGYLVVEKHCLFCHLTTPTRVFVSVITCTSKLRIPGLAY